MSADAPSLLVYVPTYNHEAYIEECLESIVSQELNIPFSALVIDDCSTDGTADVVRKYAAAHPGIIRAVLREKNIGVLQGQPPELDESSPTYFSICEGDDFFLDKHKLQKQVDFMEAHPECALCFHPVRVFYTDGLKADEIYPTAEQRFGKTRLTFDDLLKTNFIQTNSILYRWRYGGRREKIRDAFPPGILPGDWFIHLLHAETGEIGFIDEVMSAYRRHSGGLWAGSDGNPAFYVRNGLPMLRFYAAVESRFCVDRYQLKEDLIFRMLECHAELGMIAQAEELIRSEEILRLLKPEKKPLHPSPLKHYLKSKYYYYLSHALGWSRHAGRKRFRHAMHKSLLLCLMRDDARGVARFFSRYLRAFRRP